MTLYVFPHSELKMINEWQPLTDLPVFMSAAVLLYVLSMIGIAIGMESGTSGNMKKIMDMRRGAIHSSQALNRGSC